ncbi:MAG: amidohydrolase family protein [Dehalococcoidia bacterium]|nr:amidohydrolase family protein [Dehalococcoidia bacterium]
MSPTIIRNTTIVTIDPGHRVLYDAAIAVGDDGTIAEVGPSDEVASHHPDAEVVDGRAKAVFPGFFNCHTHLSATLSRGIQEDFAFPTVLQFPQPITSFLSTEEFQVMAVLGAIEGIRSGTTTFFEIGQNVSSYINPVINTGARFVLGEAVRDVNYNVIVAGSPLRSSADFSEHLADEGFTRAVDLFEKLHGSNDGLVSVYFSPGTADSVSPMVLRKSRELAEERGVGYTIHLSQSHQEVAGVAAAWGVRPAHYLNVNEFLGPRLVAAHCRYLDESEIRVMGRARVGVSNNPAIAARRGAAAPAMDLVEAGAVLGIGTDNMAEDMVEAMRTGLFVERVRTNDEMRPGADDVFEWATLGGARIMGMDQETGSLEVGKQADLFIANLRKAHLVPTLHTISDFVHNGQASDIESVMVAGNFIMRDGAITTVDEADILRRAETIAHRAWKQMTDTYPDVPFPVRLADGPSVT